jgi:hypothetical protein
MSQFERIVCFMLEPTGRSVKSDDGAITSPVWRRVETGEEFHSGFDEQREGVPAIPLGGMRLFDDLYPPELIGADGRTLVVRVPGPQWSHDWIIDGKWQRSGTAPHFSATPSLKVYGFDGQPDRWHGYLTNGVLEPC